MNEIETGEECEICGGQWTILTTTPQECCCLERHDECVCEEMGFTWWASVDDDAVCHDCGAQGSVTGDEDGGSVTYDQTSEHNMACWEKYNDS